MLRKLRGISRAGLWLWLLPVVVAGCFAIGTFTGWSANGAAFVVAVGLAYLAVPPMVVALIEWQSRRPAGRAAVVLSGPQDSGERGDASARHRRIVQDAAAETCRLPDADPYLCGRNEDVADVVQAFRGAFASGGHAIALLCGQPGVGTSTVAVEAARQLAADFTDGVLHVDLRGLIPGAERDPRTVAGLLADALRINLGVGLLNGEQMFAALAAQLTRKRILLVLDNAADAAHVVSLVKPPVALGIIVTSRDRSQDYASPGLVFDIEPLGRAAAVEVLAKLARGRRYEERQLQDLARLCDDVPLALRMIGRQIAARPPVKLDYLVRLLSDELDRLHYLQAGDQAVRAAIGLSYDRLRDPGVVSVFRLITAAPGSAGTAGMFGYCLHQRQGLQERRLGKLVDRSLARREPGAGDCVFSLFELVRLFAAERVREDLPETAVREFQSRAVSYLLDRLREILENAPHADLSAELDPARLHAAQRLAEQRGWPVRAEYLADGLHQLHLSRGDLDGAAAALDTLVSSHLSRDDYLQAIKACLRAADRLDEMGETSRAVTPARRAAAMAHEHGLQIQSAEAEFKISSLLGKLEDWTGALVAGERAASVLELLDPPEAAIPALINNCKLAFKLPDAGRAQFWGRKATALADKAGTTGQRASAAFSRGRAEGLAKDFRSAIDQARRAGSLYQAIGEWWNAGVAFGNGAWAARDARDSRAELDLRARAAQAWAQARGERGQERFVASLIDLGAAQFMGGSYTKANPTFTRADEAARKAPGVSEQMRLEAQLRRAGIRIYSDQPIAAPGHDLVLGSQAQATGPDDSEYDSPDSEMERVAAVLDQYESAALNAEQAKSRIFAFMGSPALSRVKPTPTWLYDKLGKLSEGDDRSAKQTAELPITVRRLELN